MTESHTRPLLATFSASASASASAVVVVVVYSDSEFVNSSSLWSSSGLFIGARWLRLVVYTVKRAAVFTRLVCWQAKRRREKDRDRESVVREKRACCGDAKEQ